jgi:hypothetical protein
VREKAIDAMKQVTAGKAATCMAERPPHTHVLGM